MLIVLLMNHKILVTTENPSSIMPLLDIISNDKRISLETSRDLHDSILFILEDDVSVALLDLDGRVEKGLKTLKILSKIRPRVPIIVVSSSDNFEEIGPSALESGAYYCLVKPIPEDIAEEVLKSTLARAGANKNRNFTT